MNIILLISWNKLRQMGESLTFTSQQGNILIFPSLFPFKSKEKLQIKPNYITLILNSSGNYRAINTKFTLHQFGNLFCPDICPMPL